MLSQEEHLIQIYTGFCTFYPILGEPVLKIAKTYSLLAGNGLNSFTSFKIIKN